MRAPTEAPGADAASERSGESLRVRLFGGVDLRWGDRDAIPVESGRMRSLLGFLVLHAGAVHARQNLAFLLWPDSTESQARTNLRKLLHALRRELPDLERHVAVTPSSVSWRRDPTPARALLGGGPRPFHRNTTPTKREPWTTRSFSRGSTP